MLLFLLLRAISSIFSNNCTKADLEEDPIYFCYDLVPTNDPSLNDFYTNCQNPQTYSFSECWGNYNDWKNPHDFYFQFPDSASSSFREIYDGKEFHINDHIVGESTIHFPDLGGHYDLNDENAQYPKIDFNTGNSKHLTFNFNSMNGLLNNERSHITPIGSSSGSAYLSFESFRDDLFRGASPNTGPHLSLGTVQYYENRVFSFNDFSYFSSINISKDYFDTGHDNMLLSQIPFNDIFVNTKEGVINSFNIDESGWTCTLQESDIILTHDSQTITFTNDPYFKTYSFTLYSNDQELLSPKFTITSNKNVSYYSQNNNYLFEIYIAPSTSHIWTVEVSSENWNNHNYIKIGSPNSNTPPTFALLLDTTKPIVSFAGYYPTDSHIYLNQNESIISSIQSSTTPQYIHISSLIAGEPRLYIASSEKIEYYVDQIDPHIQVYFGESKEDSFYSSSGSYRVQNIITFPYEASYLDDSSQISYQNGVFLKLGTHEPYEENEFNSAINNLEILNGTLINFPDVPSRYPVFLNKNISFSGSKYFLNPEFNWRDETLSSHFTNLYSETSSLRTALLLCQPDLDCSKFEFSYKENQLIYDQDWYEENPFSTVCGPYNDFQPITTTGDNCCPVSFETTDVTSRMTCVGFRIDYSKIKSKSIDDQNYHEWISQLHKGIQHINLNSGHPLDLHIFRDHSISNVEFNSQSAAVIIDTDGYPSQYKFRTMELNSVYFKLRNQNNNIIPFQHLTINTNLYNPNPEALDWSNVSYLKLPGLYYNQHHEAFRNINDLTLHFDSAAILSLFLPLLQDYSPATNIFLQFYDLGINITGTIDNIQTSIQIITLYNTQRNRHIEISANLISFFNPSIIFSSRNTEYKFISSSIRVISITTPSLISFEAGNSFSITFDSANTISFTSSIIFSSTGSNDNNININIGSDVEQSYQYGSFTLGSITLSSSSDSLNIHFTHSAQQFSTVQIETITCNGNVPSIECITSSIANRPSVLVGTLNINSGINSISYDSNYDIVSELNIDYSSSLSSSSKTINYQKTYSTGAPRAPNLNINLANPDDNLVLHFGPDSSSIVGKISLQANRLETCQGTETIFKRVYSEKFKNSSYYEPYPGFKILTCQEERRWTSFESPRFEYCPNQYAQFIIEEISDVKPEIAKLYGFYTSDADSYVCLIYSLDDSELEKDLINPYYYDSIGPNGYEIKLNE